MDKRKQYISKEKFEELRKELEHLKTQKRKEIAEQLEYARSLGDLSENAEYKEARELQALVETKIAELEDLLSNVEIVKDASGSDEVVVGSLVVVKRTDTNEEREYKIVAPAEANIKERKVSYTSPLGEALLGKKKNDKVEVETPNGKVEYIVIKIS